MNALVLATLALAVSAPADEAWRAERPAVPPAEPPVLPEFQRSVLPNGLHVYSVELTNLPLVSFSLVTRGGAAADPQGKAGLTSLLYEVMQEGAGPYDALAFSDRVADFGASLGGGADRDSASLAVSGLARHAADLLNLLTLAAREPRLDEEGFQRRKEERIASLTRQLGSPQGIAFSEFAELLYGAQHPYGHPPSGTLETVSTLTLADVKAQHAKLMAPDASALVVAGALSHAEALALAEEKLGAWEGKGPSNPIPFVEASPREQIVLIDKPGPQTMVVLGRPLPAKGHPDEFAIRLLNEVYGGTFSSRVNLNLREEKGYTYGAGSQVSFRRGVGGFVAYGAIRTDVTGAALVEFFGELKGLAERPATDDEIQRAKDGIVRSLTGRFETGGSVASAASALFLYDLKLDYFRDLGPRYEATPADAVRAAQSPYFESDAMKVLLVGDAAVIRPQLELAGFTSIHVRTP
ncbi:MAG: M16 family metallopeptidase [Myxococcota bacterium]